MLCERVLVWILCCSGVMSCFCNVKGFPSSSAITGEQGHLCERWLKTRCCFCPGLPVFWAVEWRGLCVTPTPPNSQEPSRWRRPCQTSCNGSLAFLHLGPWHCLWARKGTILDIGGSLYTTSNPFVTSYPVFGAVLYRQSDINQMDYRGESELHPHSKITRNPDLQCDLGHSNK